MAKISVLLPYYNDQKYLFDSICSVLNQSFTDFELILINHASNDDSRKIAHNFKDSRIRHIDLKRNYGAGGGIILKTFLQAAQGEYFKSMCADDVMKINCLKTLSHHLDNHPSCTAVFGDMKYIDKKGNDFGKKWYEDKKFNIEDSILERYFNGFSVLPYPAAMVRMEELKKLTIDNVIFGMFDMSLWVQLLVKNLEVKCISDIVCYYRIHEEQESSSSKLEKLIKVSNYECHAFYQYFLKLPLFVIKNLLPNSEITKIANEEDKNFLIAHHFSLHDSYGIRFFAIYHLHQILQDDQRRSEIEEKFGYSIKDLRENYSNFIPAQNLSLVRTSRLIKEIRRRIKFFFFTKRIGVV